MHLFHRIFRLLQGLWGRFLAFGHRVGWGKVSIGAALILVIFFSVRGFFGGSSEAAPTASARQVEVKSVAELSNQVSPLSLVGTVQSISQATVRTEISGPVIGVYHSLGNYVAAGAVIGELENSSQRAAVLQAQGGVDAAQAALNKINVGTGSTKASAVTALLTAYSAVDSAISATTDPMFNNPGSNNPQFKITTSNSQLVNTIQNTRTELGPILSRQASRTTTINEASDLTGELSKAIEEVRTIRNFVDNVLGALNSGIPSPDMSQTTIDAHITAATAARTVLTTALSSLTSSLSAITNAQGGAGAPSADVAAGEAALKQAQGALAAARANLEKSIIRAPISGTLNSLNLKRGDFVQALTPVATVANNGALEIVAYLSQQDTNNSVAGDQVEIEGGARGVITHIAPALDPVTKKIEVRIGISNQADLINGQSVIVSLRGTKPSKATSSRITIPITAIKIGAQQTTVFTVSASSTLEAHPIVLGELLGDKVVVTSGLSPSMQLVVDARGLRAGEAVEVK